MFLLAKILPLLILPVGLVLSLLLWSALSRRRAPFFAAIALLWFFATPLTAEALWRWLEYPYQRRSAKATLAHQGATSLINAVVVLGTGRQPAPGPEQISEWTDADRFFGGVEVYRLLRSQGQTPTLIFTGGWWPTQPHMPTEGETLRQAALTLGLPLSNLKTTPRVRNTAEEAHAVAASLPPSSRVVLVTSAFHMPRASRLFERQGLTVIAYPVDFQATGVWAGPLLADPLNLLPSATGLSRSSRALHEAIGRTMYRAW